MVEKRGRLEDQDVDRFIAADFGKDHALEVITIVAASTITNDTGRITKTPLEAPLQAMPAPAEQAQPLCRTAIVMGMPGAPSTKPPIRSLLEVARRRNAAGRSESEFAVRVLPVCAWRDSLQSVPMLGDLAVLNAVEIVVGRGVLSERAVAHH
jgi:hypothetical protein